MMLNYHQTITRDFLLSNEAIFMPETKAESAFIQKQLFEMGCMWADNTVIPKRLADSVVGYLKIAKGRIYYAYDKSDVSTVSNDVYLCTSAQFDKAMTAEDAMSPENKLMMEKFNELSAKVDRQNELIQQLLNQLNPDPSMKKIRRLGNES